MTEKTKLTSIRMPAALHERLARVAAREHRSLSSQVVVYVERGLAGDGEEMTGDDRETPPRAR